jgi:hypothetical protein
MMHHLLEKHDPAIFKSYMDGKVHREPKFVHDHPMRTRPARRDARADVVNSGGSMNGITHSENGRLIAHNSDFHHHIEIV